jgi:ribose transport system ATP-binding protein
LGAEITAAALSTASQPLALSVRNLSKSFGGARALAGIDLDVAPGEVRGLLGTNGSGKSTFVKVLAGFHTPDTGTLELHGHSVRLPLNAGEFRKLGLAFVHQNLGLVPSLTVLENLRVGELTRARRGVISWGRERRKATATFERFGIDIDPLARVADLSQVDKALLAVVRAFEELRPGGKMPGTPGLLLLDEPTPFLPKSGVDKLFGLVRQIVEDGASVIFISHDIDECLEITDSITVLRDGKLAGSLVTQNSNRDQIVEMIVGHRVERTVAPPAPRGSAPIRAQVAGVAGPGLQPTSVDVREGEILGLTGLIGSGYEQMVYLLFGARAGAEGTLLLGGETIDLRRMNPARAIRLGMALLPADRQGASGVDAMTVTENMLLPDLSRFFRNGLLDRAGLAAKAAALSTAYEVKPNNPSLRLGALSGGNAQKVLLAKWLNRKPVLLMLDEPTQGVDIGTRAQVFKAIHAAAEDGAAVICASSDLEQLAELCNRVLVFGRGRVIAEVTGDGLTKDNLARLSYSNNAV